MRSYAFERPINNKSVRFRVSSFSTAIVAAFCASLFAFSASAAESKWSLCGVGLVSIPDRPPADVDDLIPGGTHISADDADLVEEGTSTLRGNVQVIEGDRQLQADTVLVTRPQDIVNAEGNIRFWENDLYVTGESARVDLQGDETTVNQAGFTLLDSHARGAAGKVTLTGRNLLQVEDGTYTTCDPGEEDWVLKADEIKLDRVAEFGTARNVMVKLKGVPIFYSPWMTFPLSDRRKSGFLTPSYRVSGETGFELHLPYYWNIAPNRDATLTARGMTKRGVLLQGEYRYLTSRGDGQLGLEYLPHDAELGDDRAAFSFQHDGSFAPRWHTDVDVDWVSDENYFEELGTNLEIASQSFLERRGDLYYSGNHWSAFARVQDYQTVDETIVGTSRPYKRLPQLVLNATTPARNRKLNARVRAEFVNFDRSSSTTGTRVDIKPSISYPIRTAGAFFEPRVTGEFTAYSLDGTVAGADEDPSRAIGTFSADAGLFFDRGFQFAGGSYVQTLEPRLFYLYVPFDDQGDLPVFDTGQYTFSFAQLFREGRFSGADRVGDANQLTVALTTRLLSSGSGVELLRASIGQILFFRDRRVQFEGIEEETEGLSDFVGELSARVLRDWRVTAGFQWNTSEGRTDRNTIRVRYKPDTERVLNLEYRFVRGAVEQTDVSFRWPFRNNWGVVGRWNYAIPESRTLEAVGGLEYDSCCWSARAVVRHFLRNTAGDFDTGVFFQLELKGLAGLGKRTEEFLKRSIPGYQNTF